LNKILFPKYWRMLKITISPELKNKCPSLRLCCIEADVEVFASSEELLAEINFRNEQLSQSLSIENISNLPAIRASRKAYKACGKDPARYRLSAEALLRRIVSGKGLYQISNVVDQLNLVSITSGFSIGGYDVRQIQGDISFGIGLADEPYFGIGKGELNIEHLPVFRDGLSAFGTPTSDSQRTEVNDQTRRFLMILIDFGGDDQLNKAVDYSVSLLKKYCRAEELRLKYIL
jgi:DNA/RNA-binding domain of Phe-tRNA-synthetase-like protein